MEGKLNLTGEGGCYVRVSGNKQEVERQYNSLSDFERRHGVTVGVRHRYEDDMPRDMSDKRPDFQRMIRAAESGDIKWVYVDHIDRFGFKDEWELVEMLGRLRKAGCRLFDATDDDWTERGLMSFFRAGLAGHNSHDEQVKKSLRTLGGKVAKAKHGEWQGGPPRLGFDVACFDRATGEEKWRVIWEGREVVGQVKRKGKIRPKYHILRRKVYRDGREERLDGNVEKFRSSKDTEVMRITPSKDPSKLGAVQGLFTRYATETVSFFDLAKWLNQSGIRNAFGHQFQSNDIRKMLSDESYLGYPTINKRRNGRFHRFDADGGVVEIDPKLKGKDTESDPEDRVRSSIRCFDPMIERTIWEKVQAKLAGRKAEKEEGTKPKKAPRNANLYFSGIVVCSGCGKPMMGRTDRKEYCCATWDKYRTRGDLANSTCERNGVKQEVIEEYLTRYLEEAGRRLEILTGPNPSSLTGRLEEQEGEAWGGFRDGIERLTTYLADNHPEDYAALLEDYERERAGAEVGTEGDTDPEEVQRVWDRLEKVGGKAHDAILNGETPSPLPSFVEACLSCYRAVFDASGLDAEIARLEGEHTSMMNAWKDLPTPRAKEKARAELASLEEKITGLERQKEDASGVVEGHYRHMRDLQHSIVNAQAALRSEEGEQALRRRAEAIRGLLCRIECEFVLTGKGGKGGKGQFKSRLASIRLLPIAGDVRDYRVEDGKANGGFGFHANPWNSYPPILRMLTVRYVLS